ncbi:MAG: YbhB/YbcL family Raf kinase inhibitor-like protein, partial [Desulfotignum sp.]
MKLTSTAFNQGERIPSIYTCDGDNINPPLEITGVPHEAQSLVLIMDDPDVPKSLREDGMWDHWVVFNIPPDTRTIEENTEPEGTPGIGTNEETGYFGPCPPDREHRYFFKLFALDTRLDLPEKSTKALVEEAMAGHVLFHAELMGTYERT